PRTARWGVRPRAGGLGPCLLRDFDDDVMAWWRAMTLGIIENVCVLPQDGLEDLVYFVVNRTIDGVTRRFIERLAPRAACVGGTINAQADCHVLYQGAPTSTVSVPHLPNTAIVVWADGSAIGGGTTDGSGNLAMPDGNQHSNYVAGLGGLMIVGSTSSTTGNDKPVQQVFSAPQATLTVGAAYNGYPCEVFADIGATGKPVHIGALTVANGVVTLPNNQIASTIIGFLGYVAPFQSAKLAYAAQLGSALTMTKKVDHVGLVMFDTHYQGVLHGQRFDALDPLPLMEADQATPTGTVWSEYDMPSIALPGEWNTDARLCLLAQAPVPCTIGAAVISVQTNERT